MSSPNAGADLEPVKTLTDNVHRAVGMRRAQQEDLPIVTAQEGFIHVEWPDKSTSQLPNKNVRIACQCASCVHEFTGEQILKPEDVNSNIQATSIDVLGNYAVSIAWDDGHSSGIFSWDRLREIAAAE
jgi:DUF971 family protein